MDEYNNKNLEKPIPLFLYHINSVPDPDRQYIQQQFNHYQNLNSFATLTCNCLLLQTSASIHILTTTHYMLQTNIENKFKLLIY